MGNQIVYCNYFMYLPVDIGICGLSVSRKPNFIRFVVFTIFDDCNYIVIMASVPGYTLLYLCIPQSVITGGITQFVHIIAQIGLLLFGGVMCSFVDYALFSKNLFIPCMRENGKRNWEKSPMQTIIRFVRCVLKS